MANDMKVGQTQIDIEAETHTAPLKLKPNTSLICGMIWQQEKQ